MWLLPGLLVILPALAALAGHVYLGTFSRRIADDFCTAAYLRHLGFWGSQIAWYRDWSGRFAFTLLVNLTHLPGHKLTPWLPGVAIGAWLGTLLLLMRRLVSRGGPKAPSILAPALASLTLALTLDGSPNVYQSLYWQTGMLTYTFPLILGTLYLAWAANRIMAANASGPIPAGTLLGSASLTFVAGGFSETYAALQMAGLAFGLLLSWALLRGTRRTQAVRFFAAGIVGAGLSFAAVALAPGNVVRLSTLPPNSGPVDVLMESIRNAYIFVYQVAKYQTLPLLLAVILPALLSLPPASVENTWRPPSDRKPLLLLGITPVLTATLLLVPFIPYQYAVGTFPDGRVLITQQYVLFLGIIVWSAMVGRSLRPALVRRWPAAATAAAILIVAAAAIMALGAGRSTGRVRTDAPIFSQFAASWDDRDAYLRAEAARDPEGTLAAPSLRHMGGLAEIGADPGEWINVCVAEAYDARQVIAK